MVSDAEVPFAQLLRLARAGDRSASARLFERLAGEGPEAEQFHRMAQRILPRGDRMRDFVESRDLMQSALRSGWLDLSSFEGETAGEFLAWMRAILRRKLSRQVRRRTPRPQGGLPAGEEAAAAGRVEDHPLTALIREEVRARVRSAVKGLPEHERAVMEMRLRGLNSTEIAEITGLEPAAVRKRESRAAARLRAILGEGGVPG